MLGQPVTPEAFQAAVAPLEFHGIPCSDWTVDSSLGFFLLPHRFLKAIKIVTSVQDTSYRSAMIQAMIVGGFFDDAANVTPKSLYEGCNWLKTNDGKKTVQREQLRNKLQKKASGTSHSVEQMSHLVIFDHQVAELAIERKKLKQGNETRALETKFLPAGEYVDMNAACLDAEMYSKCGNLARKSRVVNFLAADVKRVNQLRAYLESKILYFHDNHYTKLRDRFLDHLAVGFGGNIELPNFSPSSESSRAAKRPRFEENPNTLARMFPF